MAKKDRINFSKIGAIAAATGSALGLGNIWRFPYLLGESGGGAFLLVYILCVIFLGLPVMISEFSIGRMAQANAAGSFRTLAPKGKWWLVGLMGDCSFSFGFYVVVSGGTRIFAHHWAINFSHNPFPNYQYLPIQYRYFRPIGWKILFTAFTFYFCRSQGELRKAPTS
jgi:NSS family neurotransmitter:Na+ symporter